MSAGVQADYPLTYDPLLGQSVYNRLLGQDKDKTVIVALATATGNALQAMEDAFFDFATSFPLTVATGAALDRWGAIVGQTRLGLVDADYRRMIQAKILINLCNGSIDAISKIVQTQIEFGNAWTVTPDAGLYYVCFLTPAALPRQVLRAIKRGMIDVHPVGIEMHLTYWQTGGLVLADSPPGTPMLSGQAGQAPVPPGYESRLNRGTLGDSL